MGKDKKEKSRKSFGILAAVVIVLLLVTGGLLVYQQVLSSSLNNIRYVSDSDYEVGNSRYACDGKWRVSKYKFYETDMYILNASRTPKRNEKTSMKDAYNYMVFDSVEDAAKTYEWYYNDFSGYEAIIQEGKTWFITRRLHVTDAVMFDIYYLEENVIISQTLSGFSYSDKNQNIEAQLSRNNLKNYLLTHASSLRVRLLTDLKNDLPL